MAVLRLRMPTDELTEFRQRHGVRRLSVFGSALRDDFRDDSDLDILIEFEDGRTPGFFRLMAMQAELSELMGRPVDLRTPADLSRYFRDQVLAEAQVVSCDPE